MLTRKIALWLTALLIPVVLLFAACGEGSAAPGKPTAEPLTITTNSLPDGQVGIVYSQMIKATGGSGSYTWTITEGSLPAGFTLLAKNGSINGTSSTPGKFNFTVQVSDGVNTATKQLSITIKPTLMPLFIENTFFEAGEVGIPYNRPLGASGGSGTYFWTITDGSLPDGLVFDEKAAAITGTPQKEGTFYFTLRVTDSNGTSRSSTQSITIKPYITISTASLPDGKTGTSYDEMLEYSGGVGNVTWSISSGALPEGLTLDSTYGEIYGKPTAAGVFKFTLVAKDKLGASASKELSITVNPG